MCAIEARLQALVRQLILFRLLPILILCPNLFLFTEYYEEKQQQPKHIHTQQQQQQQLNNTAMTSNTLTHCYLHALFSYCHRHFQHNSNFLQILNLRELEEVEEEVEEEVVVVVAQLVGGEVDQVEKAENLQAIYNSSQYELRASFFFLFPL